MDAETLLSVHPLHAEYAAERQWAAAVRDSKLSSESERTRWLVKGPLEEDPDFKNRAKLTVYSPLSPLIAGRVDGTVFKRQPLRVYPPKAKDGLEEFANAAASDGRSLGEFTANACMSALWSRYAVALVDRPAATDAGAPLTLADAQAQGLAQPYCVLYPAEQVLDWRQDKAGRLEYIKLDGPTYQVSGQLVREVREITVDGIRLWRLVGTDKAVEGGEVIPLSPRLAEAGMLPVAVAQYDPIGPVFSRSMLGGALLAEMRAFRLLSDIIWDLYLAGHPTLAAWVVGALAQVGVGATQLIKLNPGGSGVDKEDVRWIEAELPGLTLQLQAYDAARAEVFQQAGVRPAGMTAQPAATSGVQVAWDFETSEAPVLSRIARMAAELEETILEIVALDMELVTEDDLAAVSVTYPSDFGLMSVDKLQYNAGWARQNLGPQHVVTKFVLARVAAALLDNAPDEIKTEAQKQIEAEGAYSPAPMTFGE